MVPKLSIRLFFNRKFNKASFRKLNIQSSDFGPSSQSERGDNRPVPWMIMLRLTQQLRQSHALRQTTHVSASGKAHARKEEHVRAVGWLAGSRLPNGATGSQSCGAGARSRFLRRLRSDLTRSLLILKSEVGPT